MSTANRGSAADSAEMFPLTAEVADKVVATAMATVFPGTPVSRVEFPNKGYQAMIRFALDSHTIVAYMIPAKGFDSAGKDVPGFTFEVSHSGTMPLSGSGKASSLFKRIVHDAKLLASPLPLAPAAR